VKHKLARLALIFCTGLLILVVALFYLEINHDRFFSTAGDQAAAVQMLRNMFDRESEFRSQHGCFAEDLRALPNISSQYHGYSYSVEVGTKSGCAATYVVVASPSAGMQRRNAPFFAIDENGTVRVEWNRPPSAESRVVQ
jgi:hypothetical protein